ncbi:MAG: hypothetical protein HYW22_00025 [Candidatus Aenigmarchaeota archaeon]|nr:hypothetical protein [Candidatus Aenigmarchaeota archaeon]
MASILGSRYTETRLMLKKRIRDGNIEVSLTQSDGDWCYFCLNRIRGQAVVLIYKYALLNDYDGETDYFCHKDCYTGCKN